MRRLRSLPLRGRTFALVALVTVLMMAATLFGLVEALELDAVNQAFRIRGEQLPTSPIVIVAIDDNSFKNNNLQWPWPRTYFAQLVDTLILGGAKVIAFDVFFIDPEYLGKPATYTVRGETLKDIADQYGVTLADLAQANQLANGGQICPGQELTIPTTPAQTHVLVRDSLEDIAHRYQTSLTKLMQANGLTDPCEIQPRQLLSIPVLGAVTYSVKEGETVESVARSFQVNPLAVVIAEGHPAADPLVTGETLTIQFGDAALAASIRAAGNVVLNGEKIESQPGSETLNQPIPILREAAAGFGLTNVQPEVDGVVHQILAWNQVLDEYHYSWPIAAASLYSGQPLGNQFLPNRFRLGDRTVPLERANVRVNFLGDEGTIPTYPFLQVVNGDLPPETFKGKIVFVGATTESLQDTYPTPFSIQNPMPGVEIMGNLLETVLSGRYLRRASPLTALFFVLAAGGIALLLTLIRRPNLAALALLGVMAAYALIWLLAFLLLRWEIPLIAPEITLFIAFVIPTIERAVSEELEKRRVRGIFELFISPEMVGQLIEQGIDAMRGQRAELTILFSDIRGFTTMSEKMTPEELVNLLNEYLGAMTDVIHKHGGTVDKYEGDLVMAFFGAPLPHNDHAQRAVRTSIEMRQELDRLRAKWETEGKPSNLEMGIGLNTGDVFVGLVGSGRRVNYTVMGDVVNLASRLQDLTKEFQWPLLISEFTYQKIKDEFEADFAEARLVKGKTIPVGIYKVRGAKGAPESERVRPLYAFEPTKGT